MTKNPEKPKKRTMQNLVYEELRRSIMTGAFAPGEKVSLRSLAEQMGTSMMPVREAVNRLTAERAFEMTPNRMVKLPVMTLPKFSELTHWRLELESAATRAASENVTPELIEEITRHNDLMIQDVENDSLDSLLPNNYNFHFAIYRASGSEVLIPMIESLWLQVGPFTCYSTPSPKGLWTAKYHNAAIDALKAGDAEAAVSAIQGDINSAADYLLEKGNFNPTKIRRIF